MLSFLTNPFHPTFGASPPLLAGRDSLLESFEEAIEDGPGASGRATLYTGARGSGKTVMLNAVEDIARRHGWIVISETASKGFIRRIAREYLPRLLGTFDPNAVRARLTGLSVPLISDGATWATVERHIVEMGFRSQIELLTDLLADHGTGLLITLDEIHLNRIDELRELATVVQHGFREDRELSFAGAGLASAITDLVNDEVLTFLRRSERHSLGSVGLADVELAIREPVEAAGRDFAKGALDVMVEGTRGYPFLIQLVGAQAWRLHPTARQISLDDAREGVNRARRRLGPLIHEPALAGVSGVARSFLLAMAEDDGRSKMADVQRRLGVDKTYASQYRLRLIAAELIESAGHGHVDFALPYLREYLREQDTDHSAG